MWERSKRCRFSRRVILGIGRLDRQQNCNKQCEGMILYIILGIVLAVVGGWHFRTFGGSGVTELNISRLAMAVVGAIVVMLVYQRSDVQPKRSNGRLAVLH